MTAKLDPNEFTIIPRLRFGALAYPGNVTKATDFCRRIGTAWLMVFEADDHETNLFALPFWEQRFRKLAEIVAELHREGVRVMLNMQVTFGHGGVANTAEACGFRMMRFPDGRSAPSAPCVLDESFQQWAVTKYRLAARAGFDVIFIDDDYRQANHGRREGGCYCDEHLTALAQALRRPVSAQEMDRISRAAELTPEERRTRDAWNRHKREGLEELGRRIVEGIREERPDAHVALMLCGVDSAIHSNMDVPALINLLCSKDPVIIRPPDGGYSGYDHEASAIYGAFHSAHMTGLAAPSALATPDTDNMSRSRFAKCARSYVHEGLRHIGYGVKVFSPAILDSVPTDWDDDGRCQEELVGECARMRELAQLAEKPLWQEKRPYLGVHLPLEMGAVLGEGEIDGTMRGYFEGVSHFLRLGFYLSPSPNTPKVCLAGGQAVKVGFVDRILRRPDTALLLDGEAAWELAKMGHADAIGCRAEPETGYYAYERLKEHEANGRYTGSIIQCRNRVERRDVYRLQARPEALVLSDMRDLEGRRLGDGVTLFEGPCGRIAVVPFSLRSFRGWVLSRRRVQLDWVLTWLAGERPPVFVDGSPDVVSVVHAGNGRMDVWLYNCSYDATGRETRIHVRTPGSARVSRHAVGTGFQEVPEAGLERRKDEIVLRLGDDNRLLFQEVGVYRFA
ncbi:MAG: hypothetical protein V2A58_14955 [Planctomycetota bacterium]